MWYISVLHVFYLMEDSHLSSSILPPKLFFFNPSGQPIFNIHTARAAGTTPSP